MHTNAKHLSVGQSIVIATKGEHVGGGQIMAIDGNTVTIAQVTDHRVSADCAAPTLIGTELALDEWKLSRSVVAYEI